MKKVTVYTSPSCPYCIRAKDLLTRRKIPYEEVHISWDDEAGWTAMMEKSGGMKTVPQIYIDEKLVGGYTELAALDQAGELAKMLAVR